MNTTSQPNQTPSLIPRTILFGNPERTSLQLSQNGRYIAYIAPDNHNVLQDRSPLYVLEKFIQSVAT